MNAISEEVLLSETAERVRVLTLNRPKSRNALSAELRKQLFAALKLAEADEGVDVVILTGAGPAFCAGLDLRELSTSVPDLSPQWPEMSKPVIGAVNGPAITGGLEIALYCDILIASENATFADTHARVGLLPMWGMSVRLPQAVGRGMARRLSLSGEFLSAREALAAGLVTEVVPHRELLDAAKTLARSIVSANQSAVRRLVESYHEIDSASDAQALAIEMQAGLQWLSATDASAAIASNKDAVISNGSNTVGLRATNQA